MDRYNLQNHPERGTISMQVVENGQWCRYHDVVDNHLLLKKATKYIQKTYDGGYYSSDDRVYVQLLLKMLKEKN